MEKVVLNVHSIIDVITNSSTEIYTCTHGKTIEYMKELLNSVLKAGGSKKTADDLYDFKIKLDGDKRAEAEEFFQHQGMSKEEAVEEVSRLDSAGEFKQYYLDNIDEVGDGNYEDNFVVTPKGGTEKEDLIKIINSLFVQDAAYNG